MALFLGDISRFFKAGLNTRLARLKALGAAHRRKCNRQNAKGTQKVHGKNQRLQLTENKSLEMVEAGGVEPPSEKRYGPKTTCLAQFRLFRQPRSE